MKRIAVIMALVLAFSGTALAKDGKRGGPEGFHDGSGRGIVKMADELGLSQEQKRAVAQILKENREQEKALRGAMMTAREAMGDVMAKTPGDEAAVRKAAQAVGKASEDMAVNWGKAKAKIDAVLTPEQKAKAAQKREEFKKRIKERMDQRPNSSGTDEWIDKNIK